MSLLGKEIPYFSVEAFHNGEFKTITHEDVVNKWAIFMFYPADFTFVCPTELADMAEQYNKLKELGAEVYAISTDTHFSHKAWHDSSETISKITFPMLGDKTGHLAREFGVLDQTTMLAQRGTFLINPDGIITTMEVHADGIGRNAKDMVRRLQAAIFVAENDGEVCPAAWEQGNETLAPSLDLVGKL